MIFSYKRIILWLAFGMVLFLGGCGDRQENLSNGTGSEAGETELAFVSVVSPGGTPLAKGVARLWSLDKGAFEMVSSDTLDVFGQVGFDRALKGRYLLEVRSGDSLAAMGWMQVGKVDSLFAASVAQPLKGRILKNSLAVSNARVSVFDKEAYTDEAGSFEIANLPQGVLNLLVEKEGEIHSYQVSSDSENSGVKEIDFALGDYLLVDDFESGNGTRTLVGRNFGKGWWYFCTDSLQGGGSRVSEEISFDELRKSKVLHLTFAIDSLTEGHYGSAGFDLGENFEGDEVPAFYDLRMSSSISFEARGRGQVRVQLVRRTAEGERSYLDFVAVTLKDAWEKITLNFEDVAENLEAVNSINFVVQSDADFYLDNIRLNGISAYQWPSLGYFNP